MCLSPPRPEQKHSLCCVCVLCSDFHFHSRWSFGGGKGGPFSDKDLFDPSDCTMCSACAGSDEFFINSLFVLDVKSALIHEFLCEQLHSLVFFFFTVKLKLKLTARCETFHREL